MSSRPFTSPVGTTRPTVPHRTASTVLALVPAAVTLGTAAALVASWRSRLPDPVAVHFGPGGADGYSALGPFVTLGLGLFAALAVAGWLVAVRWGRDAMTRRIGVGLAAGLAAFGAVLVAGVLALQRGLADAARTPDVDPVVTGAVVAGLVLGGLCAWAVPADASAPATDPGPLDGPRLPLGPQERAVWTGRVVSRVAVALGGGATLLVAALAVGLRIPGLLVLVAALAALVVTGAVVVVTVDATGLTARSPLGWPRYRIPLDEVLGARATHVRPLADFGGWGYRLGRGGRVGYVLRTGDALEVSRTGGRTFVVTVDDAATAAALLTTLAERARPLARG
ncbi:lipase chaperone [Cellulomonas marina]|uniref:DUF1648 domain-containing protein n=1 Tax=Cellulomonas marina TaxID=988821 RepID=A0A1I0Y4G7_9CELL|nr:lipase chaperone [Cellulomonas marina]GIG28402.1 hypothetical protein Cma02nite_10020 [Cellulomonas marina]SFB07093.1 hypothetical protein SAMN05421867_106119 [Cellulomonas marina]